MKRDHTFSLYRQSGTPAQDARGTETGGWTKIAEAIPARIQPHRGRLERQLQGRKVRVSTLLMVHPRDLPSGVEMQAADIVVVASGRTVASRHLVVESVPIGELGQPWDDEVMLTDTDVDPSDG